MMCSLPGWRARRALLGVFLMLHVTLSIGSNTLSASFTLLHGRGRQAMFGPHLGLGGSSSSRRDVDRRLLLSHRQAQPRTSGVMYARGLGRGGRGPRAPRSRAAYGGDMFDLSSWTGRILLLNIGMFLLQRAVPEVTLLGAKNDILIRRGELHRLFTPMLLHGSIQHLMANSFSLHNLGHEVEALFGTRGFLALYVLSGLGGNLLSFATGTAPVALGASTAVAGVLGGLGFFCLRHRKIWNMDGQLRAIGEAVLINGIYGMTSSRIDNFGHLGGLLAGVACSFMFGPRLVPEATGLGRVSIVNKPLLQTAVMRLKGIMSEKGLLPAPTPPRRQPPSPSSRRAASRRRGAFEGFMGKLWGVFDRSKPPVPPPPPPQKRGWVRGAFMKGPYGMAVTPVVSKPFRVLQGSTVRPLMRTALPLL